MPSHVRGITGMDIEVHILKVLPGRLLFRRAGESVVKSASTETLSKNNVIKIKIENLIFLINYNKSLIKR